MPKRWALRAARTRSVASHRELLAQGGNYAELWRKQSGNFAAVDGDVARLVG